MEPITTIVGTMMPLPRVNVDTDQIMPKQFLKRVERTGYGQFLFDGWRHTPDGELDPGFVLNRPEYQNARILVTGANFGSGSSREHAPWGLQDWGFQVIIAPSFADIFTSNCAKIGLLLVTLSDDESRRLTQIAETSPDTKAIVDLEGQTVTAGSFEASFDIDPFLKHRLQQGLDDIGLTLRHDAEIDAYETTRQPFMPRLEA